ncbi:MAG: hypothetical protein CMP47_01750 [Rickettsiales bacterium]|nr:hypothetical protein [Rickettsiales bacterium]
MLKQGLEYYLQNISLAIGDSRYPTWTTIGYGSLKSGDVNESEPLLKLIAAPLVDNETIIHEAKFFELPIGGIELYQLRQAWHQKQRSDYYYRKPKHENLAFYIQADQFEIVELGSIIDLPELKANPVIADLAKSKYLQYRITHNHVTKSLYVPCVEVFRFYYSSSTSLAQQAFSGKKAEECLFNPKYTYEKFNQHFLMLRSRVRNIDAPFVGRIAFDTYALRAFENIYEKSFHSTDNSTDKHLICYPPLNQVTRWNINCINRKEGIFVTHILSCAGEFPYHNLIFNRDNNNQSGIRDTPITKLRYITNSRPQLVEGGPGDSADPLSSPDPEDTFGPLLGNFPPPAINLTPLVFESDVNNPVFEGLQDSRIDQVKKMYLVNPETKTIVIYTDSEVIEALSTAKGSGLFNKRTFQLSVIRDHEDNIDKSIESIFDVIPFVNQKLQSMKLDDFQSTLLFNTSHPLYPHTTVLPVLVPDIKKSLIFPDSYYERQYYENERHSQYLRPIALFTLIYNGYYFYLIEFLSYDGSTHAGISTLFFSEFSPHYSEDFIVQQLSIYSRFGQSYKSRAMDFEESTARFAHRFTHPKNTDMERKAQHIYDTLMTSSELFE